jgi:voltage-gated potassium channel
MSRLRRSSRSDRRLVTPLIGLGLVTAGGTVGFRLIENHSWIDALYMSVITLSTVGLGEVEPLSPAGRLFAVGFIIVGVGFALYAISVEAEALVEGGLTNLFERRGMMRSIERMSGHTIVCGYGKFGRIVSEELQRAGTQIVMIEVDSTREAELTEAKLAFILGTAAQDDVLERAGIKQADVIVVATSSESENVFITLAARELNPQIRIHARAESESGIRRLRRAGADQVVSPHQMGGLRTAASILRPTVVDFLEISRPNLGDEVDLEEIRIDTGSEIVDREVRELEAETSALRIVALKRHGAAIQLVPDPAYRVEAGDHLVVIGKRPQLNELANRAQKK